MRGHAQIPTKSAEQTVWDHALVCLPTEAPTDGTLDDLEKAWTVAIEKLREEKRDVAAQELQTMFGTYLPRHRKSQWHPLAGHLSAHLKSELTGTGGLASMIVKFGALCCHKAGRHSDPTLLKQLQPLIEGALKDEGSAAFLDLISEIEATGVAKKFAVFLNAKQSETDPFDSLLLDALAAIHRNREVGLRIIGSGNFKKLWDEKPGSAPARPAANAPNVWGRSALIECPRIAQAPVKRAKIKDARTSLRGAQRALKKYLGMTAKTSSVIPMSGTANM